MKMRESDRERESERWANERHFEECVADNQIKEAHYTVE